MNSTSTIELVAFDFGNVLCTVDENTAAIELAELSGRTSTDVHNIVFGNARKALFETATLSFAEHAERSISALGINISIEEFTRIYDSVIIPSNNMFPLVSRIAETHRIALVSNTSEPHWNLAKRVLPFADKLDPTIVSYEVDSMKPDPAFYQALLDQSGVAPENILFIDDLAVNIEAAFAAGIIGHQFTSQEKLEEILAELGVI
ncbi:MAG: HAD family phosphatase [Chloroflexi bacterium]|jgi:putative hydrolase of the HAD superfamily|nr:HAD family phosphatase [Chloroflexota bacterium]MBT5627568.1 HAD family phosphatase [Chloroflexota bacterium]